MGVANPYEMPPMGGIEGVGGTPICVEIDYPSRALISKIVCVQTEGADQGFTLALFNAQRPCGGVAESDSLGDETGLLPEDLYRVTPDFTSTDGKIVYFSDESTGGAGFVFFSQEKNTSAARLGNARKLYARITPGGSGSKKFSLALGGQSFD